MNEQSLSFISEQFREVEESYNLGGDIFKEFADRDFKIEEPEYVTALGTETLQELKALMVKAVSSCTDDKSYFAMDALKRKFTSLLNNKISPPQMAKYIDIRKSTNKVLSAQELRVLEKGQKLAEENKLKFKTFTSSRYREDIINYLTQAAITIIPIGDVDPDSREQQFYTTPEVLKNENIIRENAIDKNDDYRLLDENIIEQAINKKRPLISNEQIDAVMECVIKKARISIVEGVAGAGKSFTMEAVKEAYEKSGFKVMGTALSWSAAGVLRGSAKIDQCLAIEGLVSAMEKAQEEGQEYFERDTLLIVDEAGLVGTKHLAKLLSLTKASTHKIKVVLTGDTKQLDPVKAGASLTLLVEILGSAIINVIRRQALTSHKNMVYAFKELRSGHALNYLYQQESINFLKNDDAVLNKMVMDYINYKYNNPNGTALLLAYTNKQVLQLNEMIRNINKKLGLVYGYETDDILVSDLSDRNKPWKARFAVGDEVSLRFNDKSIPVYEIPPGDEKKPIHEKNLNVSDWVQKDAGVFNRNNGKVIAVSKMEDGSFTLVIEMVGDVSGRILINTAKYTSEFKSTKQVAFPVIHNFATTIYASQGQTVDAVFLKDHENIDFRLAYVGASRHRKSLSVYASVEDLTNRIQKNKKKSLPDEVLKENNDKRNYEFNPATMPVEQRYNEEEYLKEMSSSWGKYTENETVSRLEKKIKKKREKGVRKLEEEKGMLTIEDDTSDNAKGKKVVDTAIPDYIVDNEKTLVEVAIKMGVVDAQDISASNSSLKVEILKDWLSKVMKLNNIKSMAVNKGDELYFDSYFHGPKPVQIDFVALEEMTIDDMENTKSAPKLDSFTIEEQALIDSDNKIKLDQDRINELKDREISKLKMNGVMGEFLKDLALNNEKKNPDPSLAYSEDFSVYDYNKTERYAKDMSKSGGMLNRKEIEVFTKKNRVMPPKRDIPLLSQGKSDAYVNIQGELRFKSWDSAEMLKDERDNIDSICRKFKDKRYQYWDLAIHREVRILGTQYINGGGEDGSDKVIVKSRFDIEGNCVCGIGYPPILHSPSLDYCKKIMIVPNFKSALQAHNYFGIKFMSKINNDTMSDENFKAATEFPAVIWGAKDVDWGLFLKEKPESAAKMCITISKNPTEKEIKWASELQVKLFDQYNIKVHISGGMPADYINYYDLNIPSARSVLEERKRNKQYDNKKIKM